jgi:hypothetical protein
MLTISVLMIIIAAAVGSGALVAAFGWILFRMRSLELAGRDSGGLDALGRQVAMLQEQLEDANTSIASLTERLDFTERLLSGETESRDDEGGAGAP